MKENKKKNLENKEDKHEYKYLTYLYPNGNGKDYELVKEIEKVILNYGEYPLDNIVGLDNIKKYFDEEIIQPIKNNQKNKKIKDILLYGGPGTGKTLLVKTYWTQKDITFLNFHPVNLISKINKEGEKLISIIFDMAKYYSPTILFIDEIDLLNEKETFINELLKQMEIINSYNNGIKNIIVLGATNRPWRLKDKIVKIFEKKIYIPLLKENERKKMFELIFKNIKIDDNVNFDELAKLTEGYTNADIYTLSQDAIYEPIRKKVKEDKNFCNKKSLKIELIVNMEDIIKAIKNQNKTMSQEDFDKFENFTKEYGGNK